MKLIEVIAVVAISLTCLVCYLVVSMYTSGENAGEDGVILINSQEFTQSQQNREDEIQEITLAVVVCGNDSERIAQADTMLKSVLLMSPRTKLRVIAFVDNDARPLFTKKIQHLLVQGEAREYGVTIELKSTWFPKEDFSEWSKLYALCSTQRLFFPSLLPITDALIYLDTDILLLDDLGILWNQFAFMNESQSFGMTAEDELPGNGWYNTRANFPYYGQRGVNAGVMLMNLTRMRATHFEHRVHDIFIEYKDRLNWGDQDILNIYLYNHPEYLYLLPCEWNYRMNHCDCEYGGGECQCRSAEAKGASLFHGNKGIFLTPTKYPFTNEFYKVYKKYDLLHETPRDLIDELGKVFSPSLLSGATAKCKRLKSTLMRKIREKFEDNENELFLDFSSGS